MNYSVKNKGELTQVRDFMDANDQTVRFKPVSDLPEWEKMLRAQLIIEEVYELCEALGIEVLGKPNLRTDTRAVDPVKALDALTDILYVVFGTYHTLGLACAARDAFEEVHLSNMSKLGEDGRPYKNAAGKVMKGPNYFPPNLFNIVQRYTLPTVVQDPFDESPMTDNA